MKWSLIFNNFINHGSSHSNFCGREGFTCFSRALPHFLSITQKCPCQTQLTLQAQQAQCREPALLVGPHKFIFLLKLEEKALGLGEIFQFLIQPKLYIFFTSMVLKHIFNICIKVGTYKNNSAYSSQIIRPLWSPLILTFLWFATFMSVRFSSNLFNS